MGEGVKGLATLPVSARKRIAVMPTACRLALIDASRSGRPSKLIHTARKAPYNGPHGAAAAAAAAAAASAAAAAAAAAVAVVAVGGLR